MKISFRAKYTAALLFVAAFLVMAFCIMFFTSEKAPHHGTVHSYQDRAIFIESYPDEDWLQLGVITMIRDSVNAYATFSQAKIILDKAIKDYPLCEGVIITDLNFHEATVIKFK